MAEREPPAEPAVDDDGNPQSPADVASEKKKKKNVAYAGLALAGAAIAITIFLAKRGSSTSQVTPDTAGALAGSGANVTTGQLDQLGTAINQLANNQSAVLAQSKSETSALTALQQKIAALGAQLAHTQADRGFQAKASLPALHWTDYPMSLPGSTHLDVLGQSGVPGLHGVTGGAPVYAKIGGSWVQGFNPKTLAKGTPEATLPQFAGYVH